MSCITFHFDDSLESLKSEPPIRPSKGETSQHIKWCNEIGSEPRNLCAATEKQELEMIVNIIEYTHTRWKVKLDDITEFTVTAPLLIFIKLLLLLVIQMGY